MSDDPPVEPAPIAQSLEITSDISPQYHPLNRAGSPEHEYENNQDIPHHIHEFGAVDKLIHLSSAQNALLDDEPVPPPSRTDKIAWKELYSKLRSRLFHQRHLMQYFDNQTLYRTPGRRVVGTDELFLDLVIVGGFGALSHELRENFAGWQSIEKFILLFCAMYSSWRAVVLLWNLWNVRGDLTDKVGIYLAFTFLIGVAVGAHSAFDDGVRPYVATSSFLATAFPTFSNMYLSFKEPLMRNPANVVNQAVFNAAVTILFTIPYLAAAFVSTERAARILFWIPIGLQSVSYYITGTIFNFLHRNRPQHTRLAFSIEHIVEKFEVLTMIVLGESVLGLVFESALVISDEGSRVGHLYGAAIGATLMLYSFQTLYVNVDNSIAKGGIHAIRYNIYRGTLWSNLHMLYHISLMLLATGLGLAIRDITVPPATSEAAVETIRIVVRTTDGVEGLGAALLTQDARWVFAAGWGGALVFSGLISIMHYAGPRSATKPYRVLVRFVITIGVGVGMPFSNLPAGQFMTVFAVVISVLALAEFVLVQADRMGFFRSENSLFSSSEESRRSDDIDSHSDEDVEDTQLAKPGEEFDTSGEMGNALRTALSARLQKHHDTRLVAIRQRKARSRSQRRLHVYTAGLG